MKSSKIMFYSIIFFLSFVFSVSNGLATTDISGEVEINSSRIRYDRRSGESYFTVQLKNVSNENISQEISLFITDISPTSVTVANADGNNSSGDPCFYFSGVNSGEYTEEKVIRFSNPNQIRFTYNFTAYIEKSETEQLLNRLTTYYENDDSGDMDGDGLSNEFEIHKMDLQTLPDNSDSDKNGVTDDQEDTDHDGLTNFDEQQKGTNPLSKDTDNDGLSDYDELYTHSTNPLSKDSDTDKLEDNAELTLNTDPNNPDSNGNGIVDGDELYETIARSDDTSTEVFITGPGNAASTVKVKPIKNHGLFNLDTNFVITSLKPIEITSETSFKSAIIRFLLPPDFTTTHDVNKLKVVYFDEDLNTFTPLSNQGVNLAEGYIWAETTHFSTFAVINEAILNTLFNQPFNGNARGNGEFIDIVFCLDSSGSMYSNDINDIRKSASKTLIDALSADDQAAVVDFDSSVRTWQTLTKDKALAKAGIDRVDSSGGTNIGAGVNRSIQEILARGLYDNKLIILLTDGQGSYSSTYTQQAKANNIIIHTIGLGSGVNRTLLAGIASGTGGNYYQVSSANQLIDVFDDIREETQDSDGDGLPDFAESNGMRNGLGTTIYTDPNLSDTDGDGLSDGEEMGTVLNNLAFGGDHYLMVSNPNKIDSEEDGINDFNEVHGKHEYPNKPAYKDGISYDFPIDYSPKTSTNPLNPDSDADGISDYFDRYPNQHDWYGILRKGDMIVVGHSLNELLDTECSGTSGLAYSKCAATRTIAMYQWSHAVMYMGNEKTLDAHPVRPSINNSNGSVDWGNIHEFLYNSHYNKIAFLTVDSKDDETASRAADVAVTYQGRPFEYPTSWDDLAPSWATRNAFYCAELLHKSWLSEGIDLRPALLPVPWVRPNDIYNDSKTKIMKRLGCLECAGGDMPHTRP